MHHGHEMHDSLSISDKGSMLDGGYALSELRQFPTLPSRQKVEHHPEPNADADAEGSSHVLGATSGDSAQSVERE